MTIEIAVEPPLQDDLRRLVAELDEELFVLTPPEFCYPFSVDEMADGATTVFVARDNGAAVGCGALRRHAGGIGEIKRMYTRPSHRGLKIGARIVALIEHRAREDGLVRLVLETGHRHPAAWSIYERAGFRRCSPVLGYPDTEWSVFYDKALA